MEFANERHLFSLKCRMPRKYLLLPEPWFLAFIAHIEFHPVMVPDDLVKAGSAIEAAVKQYQ